MKENVIPFPKEKIKKSTGGNKEGKLVQLPGKEKVYEVFGDFSPVALQKRADLKEFEKHLKFEEDEVLGEKRIRVYIDKNYAQDLNDYGLDLRNEGKI
jgi:hypothetical protein